MLSFKGKTLDKNITQMSNPDELSHIKEKLLDDMNKGIIAIGLQKEEMTRLLKLKGKEAIITIYLDQILIQALFKYF